MFADARCSAGLARWREADNVPTFKPKEEAMPYRAMALVAASLLFATQADAAKNLNSSRSNIYGAGSTTSGGGAGAAKPTTVNSSKSNNFRMGGGGGGKGASGNAVKLNSSRSN
jgi:hypothetical protein